MTKVTVTFEAEIDVEDLGAEYSNEDYLVYTVKGTVIYAMSRLDADITFNRVDVEGLE
jgi:hypothetical protein